MTSQSLTSLDSKKSKTDDVLEVRKQLEWADRLLSVGWQMMAPTREKRFGSVLVKHTIDSNTTLFECDELMELDGNKFALKRSAIKDMAAAIQFVIDSGKEVE